MTKKFISTGSDFERDAGYSRAVVQGDWCFVSGTTGYDYETMVMPDDVETQTENILDTIEQTLAEAGFSIQDVVRATYYVTRTEFANRVFPILGKRFAKARPAATMIVCELIRPEMLIEIEVTALRS